MAPSRDPFRAQYLIHLLALAGAISGCTQVTRDQARAEAASAVPSAPFAAKLDSAVLDAFRKREMPGGAVVVVQGNQVVYSKGFGFADLETRRPFTDSTPTIIGSTSKPL